MKAFLVRMSGSLMGLLALHIMVQILTLDLVPKNYNSAFVDKLARLHTLRDSQKIVIIGGSNAGFGISAEQLSKALGMPVINLGHHAGIGVTDYQDFVAENLRNDDIVLFCPEWEFYDRIYFDDNSTLDNLIEQNINYGFKLKRWDYVIRALLLHKVDLARFSSFLGNNDPHKDTPFVYDAFNDYGDNQLHCRIPKPDSLKMKNHLENIIGRALDDWRTIK